MRFFWEFSHHRTNIWRCRDLLPKLFKLVLVPIPSNLGKPLKGLRYFSPAHTPENMDKILSMCLLALL